LSCECFTDSKVERERCGLSVAYKAIERESNVRLILQNTECESGNGKQTVMMFASREIGFFDQTKKECARE
jgi:thioredoxin-related protein